MYTFLLILLILDSAVLIAAVLLQSGKGGGVAASFGGVRAIARSVRTRWIIAACAISGTQLLAGAPAAMPS